MKIKLVTTCKENKEKTLLYKSSETPSEINFYEHNRLGLPTIYNKVINTAEDEDIIVFLHSDVCIETRDWKSRLLKYHEYYDICGIAGGGNSFIRKDGPMLWHLMTNKSEQSGVVTTSLGYMGRPYSYSTTFFGVYPREVILLDGVFLSVKVKSLREKNLQFFQQYSFHHYDLSFTYEAWKRGLKSTTVPIQIIHESPGLLNRDDLYIRSEELFLKQINE